MFVASLPAIKKTLSLSLLVIGLSFGVTNLAWAQTDEAGELTAPLPSPTQTLSEQFALTGLKTDYIWERESLGPEILRQRQAYRDQLEAYRYQEKNFFIDQDQYRKHQTLDSIERAVQTTRQTLLARDQVLHTYLTLLQLRLMESEGVEISLKTSSLAKLEKLREDLKVHHASLLGQLDRPMVNQRSDEFLILGEETQTLSSQVSGLLALAKLQAIYDKTVALSPEVTTEVTTLPVGGVVSAETNRALRETERNLGKAQTSLEEIWTKVNERVQDNSTVNTQADFVRDLNTVYGQLSQSLGYLLELLKLHHT
jgi:hypothetical protein